LVFLSYEIGCFAVQSAFVVGFSLVIPLVSGKFRESISTPNVEVKKDYYPKMYIERPEQVVILFLEISTTAENLPLLCQLSLLCDLFSSAICKSSSPNPHYHIYVRCCFLGLFLYVSSHYVHAKRSMRVQYTNLI
jgi:hypothetical protein